MALLFAGEGPIAPDAVARAESENTVAATPETRRARVDENGGGDVLGPLRARLRDAYAAVGFGPGNADEERPWESNRLLTNSLEMAGHENAFELVQSIPADPEWVDTVEEAERLITLLENAGTARRAVDEFWAWAVDQGDLYETRLIAGETRVEARLFGFPWANEALPTGSGSAIRAADIPAYRQAIIDQVGDTANGRAAARAEFETYQAEFDAESARRRASAGQLPEYLRTYALDGTEITAANQFDYRWSPTETGWVPVDTPEPRNPPIDPAAGTMFEGRDEEELDELLAASGAPGAGDRILQRRIDERNAVLETRDQELLYERIKELDALDTPSPAEMAERAEINDELTRRIVRRVMQPLPDEPAEPPRWGLGFSRLDLVQLRRDRRDEAFARGGFEALDEEARNYNDFLFVFGAMLTEPAFTVHIHTPVGELPVDFTVPGIAVGAFTGFAGAAGKLTVGQTLALYAAQTAADNGRDVVDLGEDILAGDVRGATENVGRLGANVAIDIVADQTLEGLLRLGTGAYLRLSAPNGSAGAPPPGGTPGSGPAGDSFPNAGGGVPGDDPPSGAGANGGSGAPSPPDIGGTPRSPEPGGALQPTVRTVETMPDGRLRVTFDYDNRYRLRDAEPVPDGAPSVPDRTPDGDVLTGVDTPRALVGSASDADIEPEPGAESLERLIRYFEQEPIALEMRIDETLPPNFLRRLAGDEEAYSAVSGASLKVPGPLSTLQGGRTRLRIDGPDTSVVVDEFAIGTSFTQGLWASPGESLLDASQSVLETLGILAPVNDSLTTGNRGTPYGSGYSATIERRAGGRVVRTQYVLLPTPTGWRGYVGGRANYSNFDDARTDLRRAFAPGVPIMGRVHAGGASLMSFARGVNTILPSTKQTFEYRETRLRMIDVSGSTPEETLNRLIESEVRFPSDENVLSLGTIDPLDGDAPFTYVPDSSTPALPPSSAQLFELGTNPSEPVLVPLDPDEYRVTGGEWIEAPALDGRGLPDFLPGDAAAPLDAAERAAVAEYTSGGYEAINRFLRSDGTDPQLVGSADRLRDVTTTLNAALDKLPAYEGTVYRAVTDLPPDVVAGLQPGGTFRDRAFLSTSTDAGIVAGRYEFEIRGTRSGVSVESASSDARELEILFRPGTEFTVISVVQDGGRTRVIMEESP